MTISEASEYDVLSGNAQFLGCHRRLGPARWSMGIVCQDQKINLMA